MNLDISRPHLVLLVSAVRDAIRFNEQFLKSETIKDVSDYEEHLLSLENFQQWLEDEYRRIQRANPNAIPDTPARGRAACQKPRPRELELAGEAFDDGRTLRRVLDRFVGEQLIGGPFGTRRASSGDILSLRGVGRFISLTSSSSTNDKLASVNLSTGAATAIGTDIGFTKVYGLSDPNGKILGWTARSCDNRAMSRGRFGASFVVVGWLVVAGGVSACRSNAANRDAGATAGQGGASGAGGEQDAGSGAIGGAGAAGGGAGQAGDGARGGGAVAPLAGQSGAQAGQGGGAPSGGGAPGGGAGFAGNGGMVGKMIGCGNSQLDVGEDCDDGNARDDDGCTSLCQILVGWRCPGPGRPCEPPLCGDGRLDANEACDDGNSNSDDGCTGDCQTVAPGWRCPAGGKRCFPVCGDGAITSPEQCDDRNDLNGDGCSSTCRIESPAACKAAVCGDGTIACDEECDDGVDNDGRYGGCTPTCTRAPFCGDGNTDAVSGEECDDGLDNGPRYTTTPQLITCGWGCRRPHYCGDTLVDAEHGEACDLGAMNGQLVMLPNGQRGVACTTACQLPKK